MNGNSWWARHGPFLVLTAFLFLAAFYVDRYLDAFTYVLMNSRLFFQLFIGITVIAVLKNVVGLKTYGTFAPAIIAIVFLQAGLVFGTVLLLNVLFIAIATRELVRRELVQQDHRIAILVIMIGLSIVLLEILAEYFHYPQLDYAFLFPILILAWIAERYVEGVDRTGWDLSSRRLLWTILATVAAYVVMIQAWLVDFIILNPLTWPLLILANWFLGTRVRFRLLERRRFRPAANRLAPWSRPGDVLTMNVRNRDFIAKYNDPSLFSVLTKVKVKEVLAANAVPVPATHMVLETKDDLSKLEAFLERAESFVLKPASGHGGEGILVVRGKREGSFETSQGAMGAKAIVAHAQYILTGAFGGDSGDQVIVEALVHQHPGLKALVPEGLADIRVIVLRGFPVMAMMRLPTRESGGRANLHSGAVGCGVQLSLGRVIHATWHGRSISTHPDTGAALARFEVPFWARILEVAAHAQVSSGLGYAGVDVVLDRDRGPLVLEVNKRPGLEIQNANLAGLLRRLRAVEHLSAEAAVAERVQRSLAFDVQNWEVPA